MEFLSSMCPCTIVLALTVLDYLSGVAKALYKKKFSSTKMREGLWHKFAIFVVMVIACMVGEFYVVMGLPESFALTVPLATAAISIMEITSILENLAEINPDIKKLDIMRSFKAANEETNSKPNKKKGEK